MNLVVKIGSAALDDPSTLDQCVHALAQLRQQGHRVAVVHGGGTALTRALKLLGKKSQFVNGLRITDAETRDVALMVLAGSVNKSLVAAIASTGQAAVGLCGGDGMTFRARKKQTNGCDLGYVGEICAVDPRWLKAICTAGGIPVIASLALGVDGEYYNVNADEMAAACAVASRANALVFLTDVPGVKNTDGSVIRLLSLGQIAALVQDSTVRGGMLPKLTACGQALKGGVGTVRILPATQVEILLQLNFSQVRCGTEVVA